MNPYNPEVNHQRLRKGSVLSQAAEKQVRTVDYSDAVRQAVAIWTTQSKQRALSWLAGHVRQGRPHPLMRHRIISRENQLLTLSGSSSFNLEKELAKFAADVAAL